LSPEESVSWFNLYSPYISSSGSRVSACFELTSLHICLSVYTALQVSKYALKLKKQLSMKHIEHNEKVAHRSFLP